MSPEAETALQKFKDDWLGKKVIIVGFNHPWKGEKGEVVAVDYTGAGWGIKVDLENGESCYAFKGTDIRKQNPLYD